MLFFKFCFLHFFFFAFLYFLILNSMHQFYAETFCFSYSIINKFQEWKKSVQNLDMDNNRTIVPESNNVNF